MRKLIIATLFVSICYACSTSKKQTKKVQEKQSYYDLHRFERSQSGDSAIVIGAVHSLSGETFYQAAIDVNSDSIYRANGNKHIKFSLPSGKYIFTGIWIHFESLKTKNIEINKGDSLRLDFYLKEEVSLH